MKIDELIDKYFEGLTTCEEERRLRRYFTETDELPERLQPYRPLFAYMEREARRMNATPEPAPTLRPRRRRTLYLAGGMVAALLLLLGIAGLVSTPFGEESYVIIDGVRYTDRETVEAKAREALQMAAFTDEELNRLLFEH